MQSALLGRRKPISELLAKLPLSSYNSQFTLDFDMYRSTQIEDLSQLFKYCYIENLMRPIVSSDLLQSLLEKQSFYSAAEADFLFYYKTQQNPVHNLEDQVQKIEVESLPSFGINSVVYRWDGKQWNIDEKCETGGRVPVFHVMIYNSKMYILYTEIMTYLDHYDPVNGQRKYYEITQDYLDYAEEFLMRNRGKSIDYTDNEAKSPEKVEKQGRDKRRKSDTTKSFHFELTEATRDSEFFQFYTQSSDSYSAMSSYKDMDHVDYLDLILPDSPRFKYSLQDLDNSLTFEEETTVPILLMSQYIRRDKYFNEGNYLETSILQTEQVSPKHASSEGDVSFGSMPSENELENLYSMPLENESESLDSIHSEKSCTSPQFPQTLLTRSSAAKGYWSFYYDHDMNKTEIISRKTLSRSESFGTSSWATESIAMMGSLLDLGSLDDGIQGNNSYMSDD